MLMRNRKLNGCVAVAMAIAGMALAGTEVHVSPVGDDAAAGTAAAPLRSLAVAAERARASGGGRIVLAGGMYEVERPFVLTAADRHLVFEAAPGAVPVVSAGRRIAGWRVDANGWWRASVPRGSAFAQLYVDGQRRTRPFLPRKGYYFAKAPGGEEPGTGRERFICKKGEFPEGDNPGMEVCLFHVWSITRAKVAAWNARERCVTLDTPHLKNSYEAVNYDRW